MTERRRRRLLALLLAAGTLGAYAHVLGHGFVDYDDDTYVTANEVVRSGLTLDGLRWAATTGHGSNWHPVTWLSHMLDAQLFGTAPAGHHATSVLLHLAAGLLFFLFLLRAAERTWPAFPAAALFLWHPLRVESVAWVAERKDVLSGVFFVLTLLAWRRWTRAPTTGGYALAALLLALGLMAKPMLVTTPFVLLLLDAWPLERRFGDGAWRRRVLEKLPLLLLAAASAVVTTLVQDAGGSVVSAGELPALVRLENAFASAGVYLRQTFLPTGLACFYPHAAATSEEPERALLLPALVALLVLAGLVSWAWRGRRERPFALVGLLWFLGMLVPVSGIVQTGLQAHADRYTYLPSLGLAVVLAYGAADLVVRMPILARGAAPVCALALSLLLVASARQVGFWRDSFALFGHALDVTRGNHLAHANLGYAHLRAGDAQRAAEELAASLELLEFDPGVLLNHATALLALERFEEARRVLRRLSAATPRDWRLHSKLGELAFRTGDAEGARRAFAEAVRLGSRYVPDHVNLGMAHLTLGEVGAAEGAFRRGLALDARAADPFYGLGAVALARRDFAAARACFAAALERSPDHADARAGLRDAERGLSTGAGGGDE